MKAFSQTAIALAIAALSTAASAYEFPKPEGTAPLDNIQGEIRADNKTSVDIQKKVTGDFAVKVSADVKVNGAYFVDGSASATVDNKQFTHENWLSAPEADQHASLSKVEGNSGNLGVNMAAGINNVQNNDAAIANADYNTYTGGSADAEAFVRQDARKNTIAEGSDRKSYGWHDRGSEAKAELEKIIDNEGNVGVNLAAGADNVQKNALAIASASGARLATATAAAIQGSSHNSTTLEEGANLRASLQEIKNNTGNVGVNLAAGYGNLQANALTIATAIATEKHH